MPLLRIETRRKSGETGEDRPGRRAAAASAGSSSVWPAVLAGVFVGLLVIVGIAAFLWARSGRQVATAPVSDGGSGAAGGATSLGALPTPMLGPINADYPRDTVIATINGQPYTMAELEVAVRIAHVLGSLSGDPVPAYDSPDMRGFQVTMLRRQIDIALLKQALTREGLSVPEDTVGELIDAFLGRVGSTRGQLEALMAAHGVSQAQMDAWFRDSSDVNLYIQQALMAGRDQSERNAVSRAWLDEQWDTQEVYINFYDPDQVPAGTAAPAGGGSAP